MFYDKCIVSVTNKKTKTTTNTKTQTKTKTKTKTNTNTKTNTQTKTNTKTIRRQYNNNTKQDKIKIRQHNKKTRQGEAPSVIIVSSCVGYVSFLSSLQSEHTVCVYSVWNGRKGRKIAQTRKDNDQKTPFCIGLQDEDKDKRRRRRQRQRQRRHDKTTTRPCEPPSVIIVSSCVGHVSFLSSLQSEHTVAMRVLVMERA